MRTPLAEAFFAVAMAALVGGLALRSWPIVLLALPPLVFLAIQGGTLVVTDRRLLEFRAHLEVHGAWNVKEFQGYEVRRDIDRAAVRDVAHRLEPARDAARQATDRVHLDTADGPEEFVVSRGPEATLSEDDFAVLRNAILAPHPK